MQQTVWVDSKCCKVWQHQGTEAASQQGCAGCLKDCAQLHRADWCNICRGQQGYVKSVETAACQATGLLARQHADRLPAACQGDMQAHTASGTGSFFCMYSLNMRRQTLVQALAFRHPVKEENPEGEPQQANNLRHSVEKSSSDAIDMICRVLICLCSCQKLLGSTSVACLPVRQHAGSQLQGAYVHAHLNGLPCRVLHRRSHGSCGLRQLQRLCRRVHDYTVQACEEVCWQGSTG